MVPLRHQLLGRIELCGPHRSPLLMKISLAIADIYGILIPVVVALVWRFDLASPPIDLFRISGA